MPTTKETEELGSIGAEFWPIPSALKFGSNQTNDVGSKHTARLLQEHVLNKIQASCELDYLQVTILYIWLEKNIAEILTFLFHQQWYIFCNFFKEF